MLSNFEKKSECIQQNDKNHPYCKTPPKKLQRKKNNQKNNNHVVGVQFFDRNKIKSHQQNVPFSVFEEEYEIFIVFYYPRGSWCSSGSGF